MRIVKASVEKIEDFRKDEMRDALRLMGFDYLEMNFYRRVELDGDLVFYAELYDDAILITVYKKNQEVGNEQFTSAIRFIDYVESILKDYDIETGEVIDVDELVLADNGIIVSASTILARRNHHSKNNKQKRKAQQQAQPATPPQHYNTPSAKDRHDNATRNKTTTKDFVKNLRRVKSSNVWSMAFQPKDDKVGDMLMQFKGKNGGPGDIYIYYNVPAKVWQKLTVAPSKGHAFWKLVRNYYTYAKLTGDKRTHLPNGI